MMLTRLEVLVALNAMPGFVEEMRPELLLKLQEALKETSEQIQSRLDLLNNRFYREVVGDKKGE